MFIKTIFNTLSKYFKHGKKLKIYKINDIKVKSEGERIILENTTIDEYIKNTNYRYKISDNVFANIIEYENMDILKDYAFSCRLYKTTILNQMKPFNRMLGKKICLVSETILFSTEKQQCQFSIFESYKIKNKYIPILNILFKNKTIILIIFSDKEKNIIGINKASYNCLEDLIQ